MIFVCVHIKIITSVAEEENILANLIEQRTSEAIQDSDNQSVTGDGE